MMELSELELSAPQIDILQAPASRYLLQMGQGGGKTVDLGLIAYLFATELPDVIGLIAANTYGQLSDSTLLEVFRIWKDYFGWTEWTRSNPSGFYVVNKEAPKSFKPHKYQFESNHKKIFLRNGAVIMTASLDNYKAIEGRTIGYALLDETADTKQIAIKEVITARLRQEGVYRRKNHDVLENMLPFVGKDHPDAGEGVNPLFVFTKPVKEQWLNEFFDLEQYREEIIGSVKSKTDYFSKHDVVNDRVIVLASSYHNEKNLPAGYISSRIKELSDDQIDLLIYSSPFGKSGSEYYRNFKRLQHVNPAPYHEGCCLHVNFDFNVNPYMTGGVWQSFDEGDITHWQKIRENAMKYPKNSIEDTCDAIIEEYEEQIIKYGMFYYGDASGMNTLPVASVKNYYKIIDEKFGRLLHAGSRRLLKANPRHKSLGKGSLGRRGLMNKILAGGFNVQVTIDPSCKNTIADYEYITEDANGAKKKVEEEINGIKCQKYGHMSDADDYMFCWLFQGKY